MENLTVKAIREIAKKEGLKGYYKMRKAELISALRKHLDNKYTEKYHDQNVLYSGDCSGDGEWLQHRKYGATDVSILLLDHSAKIGMIDKPDNYNSPFLMFKERKGEYKRQVSFDSEVAMDFGHFAEDFIIKYIPRLFKEQYNIEVQKVVKGNQVVSNNKYPLWTCTPDAFVKIEDVWYPVELKTGNFFVSKEWESDIVPMKYYAQVQQQLAVLDKQKGFLVGFINNRFTKIYEIERHERTIETAYTLTINFDDKLNNNIAPDTNGCAAECEFLKLEYKTFEKNWDKVPSMDLKKFNDYISLKENEAFLKAEIKRSEDEKKYFETEIQKKMLELGTNELQINSEYVATWKESKNGSKLFRIKEIKKGSEE